MHSARNLAGRQAAAPANKLQGGRAQQPIILRLQRNTTHRNPLRIALRPKVGEQGAAINARVRRLSDARISVANYWQEAGKTFAACPKFSCACGRFARQPLAENIRLR